MKWIVLIPATLALMAGPALANQCPTIMTKIDEAMATATVDDAVKAQVMALYESGKAAHEAGDHAKSEADLGEAMKLLGL